MKLIDLERKQCACEWDMGWFCSKCEKLVHWKTKAYILGKQKLCVTCAEQAVAISQNQAKNVMEDKTFEKE